MYTLSNKIMFVVSGQCEYLYFVNVCFKSQNTYLITILKVLVLYLMSASY